MASTLRSAFRRLSEAPREAFAALGAGPATPTPAPVADVPGDARSAAGPLSVEIAVMVENVQRLGEMRVADAMTPRADITALEESVSLADAIETFRAGGHSRLPVYRETLDDPIGFVHVKDLFMAYGFAGVAVENFRLSRHLRRALTVPPSMRVSALMRRMQADRVHMALVIDEFGGVDGLVTSEDLIELIIGDIEDEHDDDMPPEWSLEADGAYLADARAYVSDFEEAVGVRLMPPDEDEEVDTLGGLVFMICGRVPQRGEVIAHEDGHEFEILDADPRRIKRLRIVLRRPEAAPL